jgi:hypothetical protein
MSSPTTLEFEQVQTIAPRPPNDRGQGRKPLVAGQTTRTLTIRVPESMYAELLTAAHDHHEGVAGFSRHALRLALDVNGSDRS